MTSADESDYSRLKLFDKDFQCTVCSCELFIPKRIQVIFDEPNEYNFGRKKEFAQTLICSKCGYLHWFLPDMVYKRVQINSDKD